MTATVIDGKAVAASVRERVKGEVEELTAGIGRPPGLATVLVGDDPASAIYVRRKREACEEVGIRSFHHEPDASISQEALLDRLRKELSRPQFEPRRRDGTFCSYRFPCRKAQQVAAAREWLMALGDPLETLMSFDEP